MMGDFHVRFRENAWVRLPGVTRLSVTLKRRDTARQARMTLNRRNLIDKDHGFKNAINRT